MHSTDGWLRVGQMQQFGQWEAWYKMPLILMFSRKLVRWDDTSVRARKGWEGEGERMGGGGGWFLDTDTSSRAYISSMPVNITLMYAYAEERRDMGREKSLPACSVASS